MKYNIKRFIIILLGGLFVNSVCAQEREKPTLKLGGCLRFNYRYNDWNPDSRNQGGSFLYDVFRLNVDGAYRKLLFHAEYRFYSESSGGGMLKSGWIGYKFNDKNQLRFGQTTVPFGIQPYQSNSYFFNINYYIGLEDDDDFGISYQYVTKHWQFNAAFFKNSDLLNGEGSVVSGRRYSYDLAGRSKETNTLSGRVAYKGESDVKYEVGISGFVGNSYNIDSRNNDKRLAYAMHIVLDWKNWNLKTQVTYFDYGCEESKEDGYVSMVAFNAPYQVADKGQTYSACLSYTVPFVNKLVDNIKFYNDYSYMHKAKKGFNDSYMNVVGCSVSTGPVYIYADVVAAKNQPWISPDWENSFATGADNKWHTRLNLNVGYYF